MEPVANGPRVAAFFDLDKTIIAKSSTLAFSRPFFAEGLLSRRAVLRSAYAQFMFAVSGADHDQLERMRAYLTQLVTGWDVATVRQAVAETLHSIIDPLVYDEAVELIAEHRAAGHDIVIVSASGAEVVEPIGALLGADVVIATTLVIEDGRYTGEIELYAYGPYKAEAITQLANERGYDLEASFAYSDSATDVPMLETVGHPHAVNPDKALRKTAQERSWPILEFRQPVELTPRLKLDTPVSKILAGAAGAGALAGATAAAVYVAGRRAARRGI